jgi:GT2 family glycosyltransferase
MKLSVVVPTKNRPNELRNFLNSLWKQDLLPDQLIIIDQSVESNTIRQEVEEKSKQLRININYIHDQNINGLVHAKAVAIGHNNCNIISFYDDDIVMEEGCLKEMYHAFIDNPKMTAANGLILNAPMESLFRRIIFRLTHIGIYRDNRREVFYQLIDKNTDQRLPKRLNTLSGGLSFYRKEIFEKVPFDEKNRFHAYEDKEHSIRLELNFPNSMYLIPKARLYHNHAETNRESELIKVKNDNIEIIKLFKKYKKESQFGVDLLFILMGLFFYALFKVMKYKKFKYIFNYFDGIKEGLKFKLK